MIVRKIMKKEEKLFKKLIEIDKNIWDVVLYIQDNVDCESNDTIINLMDIRGQLHTECLRPIYKKHPALADKYFQEESQTN